MTNITSDKLITNNDLGKLFAVVFRKNSDQRDDNKLRISQTTINEAKSFANQYSKRIITIKSSKIEQIEEILISIVLKVIDDTIFSIRAYQQETEDSANLDLLVNRLIACVIVYLASYNVRELMNGQKLVHLDPMDGFYIREENTEKPAKKNHSLNIPFIWSGLKESNLQSKEILFFTYCKNYLPKIFKLNFKNYEQFYTTLAKQIKRDDRSVRRWVYDLKDYILPAEDQQQNHDEVNETNNPLIENPIIPLPEILENIDIANQLLSFYPRPVMSYFEEDRINLISLSKDDLDFTLSQLMSFTKYGLLIGPPKSGKTTILTQLANNNINCLYIDCIELLKLGFPDLRKFIRWKILHEIKKSGKEEAIPTNSQFDLQDCLLLVDHFDFLPPTKQQALLIEIESIKNAIIATTYSIPDVFSIIETQKIKIHTEQQTIPNSICRYSDEPGSYYRFLDKITFCSTVGGFEYVCQHVNEKFHIIINGFFQHLLEKANYKIKMDDFEFIFSKLSNIINIINESNNKFRLMGCSDDLKENSELLDVYNLFLENIYIPFLESEKEKLLQSPHAPVFSQIFSFENNQIKFQYNEFLYLFIITLIESKITGYFSLAEKEKPDYHFSPFKAYATSYTQANVKDRQIFS